MSVGTALAIVAHPDDIEFTVAGTLLLLKDIGWNIHFWNLANGCYGSMAYGKEEITRIRAMEAAEAAAQAGATYHQAIVDDLSILYRPELIAKVTAVVREVKPQIIITHSLTDYMEDHQNAARLAVTGAFIRAAPNFVCDPPQPAWDGPPLSIMPCRTGFADPCVKRSSRNSTSMSAACLHAKARFSTVIAASRHGSRRPKQWDRLSKRRKPTRSPSA